MKTKTIVPLILIIAILLTIFEIFAVSTGGPIENPVITPTSISCEWIDANTDFKIDENDLSKLTLEPTSESFTEAWKNKFIEAWKKLNGTRCDAFEIYPCGYRQLFDDDINPGRVAERESLIKRRYSPYLFEGEQIKQKVLVLNSEGIDKLDKSEDVYVTLGKDGFQLGNPVEARCKKTNENKILDSCNLIRGRYKISEFDPSIMSYYDCALTIETPETMYGRSFMAIEAKDINGSRTVTEGEKTEGYIFYLNPILSISVNDDNSYSYHQIATNDLTSGKTAYLDTIKIKNIADEESGVMMDMFISGTDFYSEDKNSYCPESKKLSLNNIKYYAQNGAYNTGNFSDSDTEGFRPIKYGDMFNSPRLFYNYAEIIPKEERGAYYLANILTPGQEMSLNFKVDIPKSCKGRFNQGNIFIWGEAI